MIWYLVAFTAGILCGAVPVVFCWREQFRSAGFAQDDPSGWGRS